MNVYEQKETRIYKEKQSKFKCVQQKSREKKIYLYIDTIMI